MSMRRARGTEGYLLVEMLIALSVIAVMAALMSRFLGQLGSVSRIESEITAQGELDAAASYLTRVLEGARPVRLMDAQPETNPFMSGSSNNVRFSTITRQGLQTLALREVHIHLDRSDGVTSLVHRFSPRRPGDRGGENAGSQITILENVSGLSFDYGSEGGGGQSWQTDGKLPNTITFRLWRTAGEKKIEAMGISVLTGVDG